MILCTAILFPYACQHFWLSRGILRQNQTCPHRSRDCIGYPASHSPNTLGILERITSAFPSGVSGNLNRSHTRAVINSSMKSAWIILMPGMGLTMSMFSAEIALQPGALAILLMSSIFKESKKSSSLTGASCLCHEFSPLGPI